MSAAAPPLSLMGLAASASPIRVGVERAEEVVLRLRRALVEELKDLHLEVLSPPEARKASGIVLFRVPGGLRKNYAIAARLRSRGVMVSARGPLGSGDKGLCPLPQRGGGLRGAG